ncbi:MAG TPA: STAS domain-containing protein [Candidatus Limnocylindrales bacterium]|nr:STAS domain-containing protein [Candidatus Limnocylindrales bacterium]
MLNETLMLLTIEERLIEPNIALVELKGKLAIGRESQRVEALTETMVLDGRTRAIFDMSGVDYTDSAGIGMLVLAAGKLKGAGGRLVVVAAPGGRVHHMLALTQINSIVQVCGTVVEAIAAFGETFPPAAA